MTTSSKKLGKDVQAAPPAAGAKAAGRKTRKTSDCQGGTKQRPPEKRERTPPGRRPWLPDLEKIENWASLGLKDVEISALCGVCKQTFSAKKTELNDQKKPSELSEALARGRAKGISIAAISLRKAMIGGDVNATKFFLERRGGWTQKQVIERVDLESLSDEELLALLDDRSAK